LPSIADGTKISLPGDILCDMRKGTIFAAAQLEGTRPILTGINFKIYDGILQLVAVDGFRLAVRRQKINLQGDHEFTVSNRALSEVIKLIDEQTEDVDIVIGKRLISFNVNGYVFISSLLEGEYVNFEKLIPEQYKQRAFMNSSDFINTIERVSLLISDSFTTPIRCIFNEDKVSMATKTAIGHAKEKFPLVLEGEEFEIGLNSKITLEALKACDQGNIQLRFNGVNSGIVIVSADENNKDFLYLIMPMRLKEWSN
ncbi:MAG: DNA polymerase III subunit beta, partial [Clostridia bacterium]|nr:DNA polymerase III subunit beta [Clostridia bacterium]